MRAIDYRKATPGFPITKVKPIKNKAERKNKSFWFFMKKEYTSVKNEFQHTYFDDSNSFHSVYVHSPRKVGQSLLSSIQSFFNPISRFSKFLLACLFISLFALSGMAAEVITIGSL